MNKNGRFKCTHRGLGSCILYLNVFFGILFVYDLLLSNLEINFTTLKKILKIYRPYFYIFDDFVVK